MSAVSTDYITVEQFEAMQLPESCEWELHNGTVVSLTFPNYIHTLLQRRIADQFRVLFGERAVVFVELPYRVGDRDDHRADVAVVSQDQHAGAHSSGTFDGIPLIVVEILSRSNKPYKIRELEELCLSSGALEFWQIDSKRKIVKVSYAGASYQQTEFALRDTVPVGVLGVRGEVPVSAVFDGIL